MYVHLLQFHALVLGKGMTLLIESINGGPRVCMHPCSLPACVSLKQCPTQQIHTNTAKL